MSCFMPLENVHVTACNTHNSGKSVRMTTFGISIQNQEFRISLFSAYSQDKFGLDPQKGPGLELIHYSVHGAENLVLFAYNIKICNHTIFLDTKATKAQIDHKQKQFVLRQTTLNPNRTVHISQ